MMLQQYVLFCPASEIEALVSNRASWIVLTKVFEPAHEIMALFVLRKLILQRRMYSHPVGLDVWFLVGPLVYVHTLCVRTVKALARLRGCTGSPEPSLVACLISTIISWAGSFSLVLYKYKEVFFLTHYKYKSIFIILRIHTNETKCWQKLAVNLMIITVILHMTKVGRKRYFNLFEMWILFWNFIKT